MRARYCQSQNSNALLHCGAVGAVGKANIQYVLLDIRFGYIVFKVWTKFSHRLFIKVLIVFLIIFFAMYLPTVIHVLFIALETKILSSPQYSFLFPPM